MKVLLCNRPGGAFGYISDGWANALRQRGHEVRRWNGQESTWYEYDPDLYIGCSGHRQPIPANRRAKIAIHVNPYGPVLIENILEPPKTIQWVLAQKPDVVFGYGSHDDRLMWSHWKKRHGILWVPMPCAADTILFKQIIDPKEREFDIVYLGGRWQYKAITIDTYLLPLLQSKRVSFKLHGWGDWPPGICSGPLAEDKVSRFLNSGRVGPCIAEKHTHQYGIDVPERAFKMAACGTLVIHDPVPTIRSFIPSAIVATSTNDFVELCIHWSKPEQESERLELVRKQQEEVLNNHTYYHRMRTLLHATGFDAEARSMLDDGKP